jgi:SAM-dependent methyltransferase
MDWMEVLRSKRQISDARLELIRKGASCLETFPRSLFRHLGLVRDASVGDYVKSWDVLATVDFLEREVEKDQPILDIGCFASEVLAGLHKRGYTRLSGADLNPNLARMPFQNAIHYETCNFMQTPFADASFRAITAISVIEHGFDEKALLTEMSRLLEPGGFFVASFDYWPDKIDTAETTFFGMTWTIFSRQEVAAFIDHAVEYGLEPVGDSQFEADEAVIETAGKKYTFGWLALRKTVST